MGTDIERAPAIMRHVERGAVKSGLKPEEYAAVKERWAAGGTKEDMAVVTALTALEQGLALVDLTEVFRKAGTSQNTGEGSFLPALAVAPPFVHEVSMRQWHDGEMRLRSKAPGLLGKRWEMRMDSGIKFPRSYAISFSAIATAPIMPPDIRKIARKDHLLLWEAEWRKTHAQVERPPIDPALLEHISGSLYWVVKTWDLTTLEVAALS